MISDIKVFDLIMHSIEESGLREGIEYEILADPTQKDNPDSRPYIMLHYPGDHKNILIDTKLSLIGQYDYYHSKSEIDKKKAMKRIHLAVYSHLKRMSLEYYQSQAGTVSSFCVALFVPNDNIWPEDFECFIASTARLSKMELIVVPPDYLTLILNSTRAFWSIENDEGKFVLHNL